MVCTLDWTPGTVETPGVDETSEMWVWFSDPRGVSDPYPDRIVTMGPRGGWRVKAC